MKSYNEFDNGSFKESPSPRRAWIEIINPSVPYNEFESPSPRRAWIEICVFLCIGGLRKSPSPRRAWIEIIIELLGVLRDRVALPTEGVD